MKDKAGRILYLLASIFIFVLILVFAVNLIVYLVPIILGIYIIYKLYGFIKNKFKKHDDINIEYKNYTVKESKEYYPKVDDENSKVIDVEYEEIKK